MIVSNKDKASSTAEKHDMEQAGVRVHKEGINLQFCNKKSIELFGAGLTDNSVGIRRGITFEPLDLV